MSPLVLLGSLGTALSTIAMVPHLLHAVRNRRPSGSAFAWLFGAFAAGIWVVYGLAIDDLLVAAPGFVTMPAGLVLGLWCHWEAGRTTARSTTAAEEVGGGPAYLPDRWEALPGASAGDTLEIPRVFA